MRTQQNADPAIELRMEKEKIVYSSLLPGLTFDAFAFLWHLISVPAERCTFLHHYLLNP